MGKRLPYSSAQSDSLDRIPGSNGRSSRNLSTCVRHHSAQLPTRTGSLGWLVQKDSCVRNLGLFGLEAEQMASRDGHQTQAGKRGCLSGFPRWVWPEGPSGLKGDFPV